MDLYTIKSNFDNLPLEILVIKPVTNIIGIIQISHGMAEHKERYIDFGNYVSKQGYICVIHDHRGHGNSTLSKQYYGHFYTDNENAIVEDLYQVSCWIKDSYPGYPLYLFSHSMGTLVSRIYLKKYDSFINKLILCGPPTKTSSVFLGLVIAKLFNIFYPKTKPNHILNYLTFHSYEKNFPGKNKWLSKNIKNVYEYNQDEKCGFIFTTNGFINLFKLQKKSYISSDWHISNHNLPILIIAGDEDPVIQSKKLFLHLITYLKSIGYTDVKGKLYKGYRHELLNEDCCYKVYQDIVNFLN